MRREQVWPTLQTTVVSDFVSPSDTVVGLRDVMVVIVMSMRWHERGDAEVDVNALGFELVLCHRQRKNTAF